MIFLVAGRMRFEAKLTAGRSLRCAGQKEAQEAVGRALLGVLPDGAESVVLRMGVLEPIMSGTIKATFPDGSSKGLRLGNRFDDNLVDRMREVMYREGSGTWFSVEMTVTADGACRPHSTTTTSLTWEQASTLSRMSTTRRRSRAMMCTSPSGSSSELPRGAHA